jgi:hypothetical protein
LEEEQENVAGTMKNSMQGLEEKGLEMTWRFKEVRL